MASVTSMMVSGETPGTEPGRPPGAPGEGVSDVGAGVLGAAGLAGAEGRSALRSTAPRVKIDGVVRGSLMVI
ncbi:hypothetical protein ACTI_11780 [Actinoplanes sp. OR16]|nr:hypothetical protein ACTI_11780 [Actinoplanes sp. OR16]